MSPDLKATLWRVGRIALPFLCTVVAIVVVGGMIDWRAALTSALRVPAWAVVAGVGLVWIQLMLAGLRLKGISASLGAPISWRSSTAVWSMSHLASQALPTSVGGDFVKGVVMLGWTQAPARIIGLLALERFAATLALALMVVVTLPFAASRAGFGNELPLTVFGVLAIAVTGLALAMRKRLAGAAGRVLALLRLPATAAEAVANALRAVPLGRAIALSMAIHGLSFVIIGLLLAAFATPEPVMNAAIGGPLVTFVSVLPISVGGFGVREGAFTLVFGKFGIDAASAAGVALAWWGVQAIAGLGASAVGGLWLFANSRKQAVVAAAPIAEQDPQRAP